MNSVESSILAIAAIFAKAAQLDYIGESVSQIEHALQCAYFAEQAGHSDEVIIAGLLHDIGHYACELPQHNMADLGIVHHEWIGAQLAFELGCSAKVALLIGFHVDAKRYLAAKKSTYYARLSNASKQTLSHQGGVMNLKKMQAFEQLPYFKEILQVRVNDEKAKEINLSVPGLEHYQSILQAHFKAQEFFKIPKEYGLNKFISTEWTYGIKHFLQQQHNQKGVYYGDNQKEQSL